MLDNHSYLVEGLRATPVVLEGLLRGWTQEEAQAARSGDEGWSVVEVVCHLRDVEERAFARVRAMRDETNPLLATYDQEQLAQERHYAEQNLREALAAFERLRAEHMAELAALSPTQWERPGRHGELGPVTIASQTQRLLCHDSIHAAQLAQIRKR